LISRVERGEVSPSIDSLERLERALAGASFAAELHGRARDAR
jgi:transcriptional regulator with XRE-family HTH domain